MIPNFFSGFSTETYPHKEHEQPDDNDGDFNHADEYRNEFECFNTDEMSIRRANSSDSRIEEEIPENESELVFESSTMLFQYDGDKTSNDGNKSFPYNENISTETVQNIQNQKMRGAFTSVHVELVDTNKCVLNTNHQMDLRIPKSADSSNSISSKTGFGIYERGMAMKAKLEQRREAESSGRYISPLLNPLISTPQTKSSSTPLRARSPFSADKDSNLSPRVRSSSLSRDGNSISSKTGFGIYERGMAMKAKLEQRREAESFDRYISPLLNPLIATSHQTKSSSTPLRSRSPFSADNTSNLPPRVRSSSLSRDGNPVYRQTSSTGNDNPSRSVTITARNPTPIRSRSRMRASVPSMFSFRDTTPPPLRTGSNAGLVRSKKY